MIKKIKLIIIFFIIILLTGCQNYQEINNYAIVSGISIDKAKEFLIVPFSATAGLVAPIILR